MRSRLGEFRVLRHHFSPRCKTYDSYITESQSNGNKYLLTRYNFLFINSPKDVVIKRVLFLIENHKMFRCECVFFQTNIPSLSIITAENLGIKIPYFYIVEPLPILPLAYCMKSSSVDEKFLRKNISNVLNTLSSLHSIQFPYLQLSPFTIIVDRKLWLRPPSIDPYVSPKSLLPPITYGNADSPNIHEKIEYRRNIDEMKWYRAPEWKAVPPFWQSDSWSLALIICEYFIFGKPIISAKTESELQINTQLVAGPALNELNWETTKDAKRAELPSIISRFLEYDPRLRPSICLHTSIEIMTLLSKLEIEKYAEYSFSGDTPSNDYSNSYDNKSFEKAIESDHKKQKNTPKQIKNMDIVSDLQWNVNIPKALSPQYEYNYLPETYIPPTNTITKHSDKTRPKNKKKHRKNEGTPGSTDIKSEMKDSQILKNNITIKDEKENIIIKSEKENIDPTQQTASIGVLEPALIPHDSTINSEVPHSYVYDTTSDVNKGTPPVRGSSSPSYDYYNYNYSNKSQKSDSRTNGIDVKKKSSFNSDYISNQRSSYSTSTSYPYSGKGDTVDYNRTDNDNHTSYNSQNYTNPSDKNEQKAPIKDIKSESQKHHRSRIDIQTKLDKEASIEYENGSSKPYSTYSQSIHTYSVDDLEKVKNVQYSPETSQSYYQSYSSDIADLEKRVIEIERSFSKSRMAAKTLDDFDSSTDSHNSFIEVHKNIKKLQKQLNNIDNEIIKGCYGCDTGLSVRNSLTTLENDLSAFRKNDTNSYL